MSTSRSLGRSGTGVAGSVVLRDPSRDKELRDSGVAVIPSVLDRDEVDDLTRAYLDTAPIGDSGLTVDYMRPDRSVVRRLSRILAPVWERHLDDLLVDHRVVMTTFVVKHPGAASEMFLHDDRSYVDERLYRAATLWVPLTDVGPGIDNGGLGVVPRSHLLPTGWAGSNTPDVIRPWDAPLRTGLVPVEATAGSVVVYDTRVLHASEPNLTSSPRIAVVCAVAPRSARLLHVVATGRRHRRIHAVDDDFFLDHHPREIEQQMPDDCPVIEELDEDVHLRREDVAAIVPGPVDDPMVPVPPDLRDPSDPEPLPVFVTTAARIRERRTDLSVPVVTLDRRPAPVAVLDRLEEDPGAGMRALVRRGRPAGPAPAGLDRWRSLIRTHLPRDVDLVVVEPGGRVRVQAPRTPRWRTELVPVESPVVGAGVRSADAGAALDLGAAVLVPQQVDLTIWNDGPGQLVLLAARVPDPADAVGRVLDRLGRRR